MKRILSFIMALAVLFGFCLPVSAAENYTLTIRADGVSSTEAKAGDIVTVDLVITSPDGKDFDLYSMQDYICFDIEHVRYVEGSLSTYADDNGNSVVQGSAIKFSADPIDYPNRVFVNRASLSGVSVESGTVLASFQLEVVKSGTVSLTHDKIELFKELGSLYTVSAVNATIVIEAEGGGGTPPTPPTPPTPSVPAEPEEPEKPEEPAFKMPFVDVPEDSYYYDAVEWAVAEGITDGTSDTTFSPNMGCTRAQMVTFLWRANGCPEPKSQTCVFEDVALNSYYGKALLWAIEEGITDGTSDTAFSPDMVCSRAHMATFLYRMTDGEARENNHPFTDVPDHEYFANPVQWAFENKVTDGTTDTTYSPHNTCSRAQMVVFLYRLLAEA